MNPLSTIIDSHSITQHSFTDDLQLQMSAPPDKISELLHSMQSSSLLNRPANSKATVGGGSFLHAYSDWNIIPSDVRCAPSLSTFKSCI